jgi:hypothetical protein
MQQAKGPAMFRLRHAVSDQHKEQGGQRPGRSNAQHPEEKNPPQLLGKKRQPQCSQDQHAVADQRRPAVAVAVCRPPYPQLGRRGHHQAGRAVQSDRRLVARQVVSINSGIKTLAMP